MRTRYTRRNITKRELCYRPKERIDKRRAIKAWMMAISSSCIFQNMCKIMQLQKKTNAFSTKSTALRIALFCNGHGVAAKNGFVSWNEIHCSAILF